MSATTLPQPWSAGRVVAYAGLMTEGFGDPYTLDDETQRIVSGALQRLHEDLGGVSRRLVDEVRCPVLVLPREVGLALDGRIGNAGPAAAR
ncbi:hypothetical protein OM076_32385 [Solirubrobacter ginsenosidimutans]|uniref:Uncharacterized protein n=1 Tax=Solirubrobacter ginsenosidimutans TaxID=490573 RepID=A0A9X3MYS0_9ACTN|nr:hypothetical protein [Solirubrobacter ginsenosidimutans]MDA0165012.1 hypothetical protein [Solirubrobacter ginsenosidimutans]